MYALAKIEHPICRICPSIQRVYRGKNCCSSMPGTCHPDNFNKPLSESVRKALLTGKYSIDWWEGDARGLDALSRTLYVRPATREGVGKIYDASWGGECCFLTQDGCALDYSERPRGCVSLKPDIFAQRCPGDTKREGALYWINHQEFLLSFESLDTYG